MLGSFTWGSFELPQALAGEVQKATASPKTDISLISDTIPFRKHSYLGINLKPQLHTYTNQKTLRPFFGSLLTPPSAPPTVLTPPATPQLMLPTPVARSSGRELRSSSGSAAAAEVGLALRLVKAKKPRKDQT